MSTTTTFVHEDSPSTITIQTPRLLLRPAEVNDAELLYPIFSDAEVMRYWSELPHPSIVRTRAWINAMIANKSHNGVTDFIVVDILASPAVPIGKIGIWTSSAPHTSGEIGFLLCRSYWGKGLISEALTTLLEHFFTKTTYETITADVDPNNAACLGLLNKFGFVVTGTAKRTFQLGEVWVDSVYLELQKETWIDKNAGK